MITEKTVGYGTIFGELFDSKNLYIEPTKGTLVKLLEEATEPLVCHLYQNEDKMDIGEFSERLQEALTQTFRLNADDNEHENPLEAILDNFSSAISSKIASNVDFVIKEVGETVNTINEKAITNLNLILSSSTPTITKENDTVSDNNVMRVEFPKLVIFRELRESQLLRSDYIRRCLEGAGELNYLTDYDYTDIVRNYTGSGISDVVEKMGKVELIHEAYGSYEAETAIGVVLSKLRDNGNDVASLEDSELYIYLAFLDILREHPYVEFRGIFPEVVKDYAINEFVRTLAIVRQRVTEQDDAIRLGKVFLRKSGDTRERITLTPVIDTRKKAQRLFVNHHAIDSILEALMNDGSGYQRVDIYICLIDKLYQGTPIDSLFSNDIRSSDIELSKHRWETFLKGFYYETSSVTKETIANEIRNAILEARNESLDESIRYAPKAAVYNYAESHPGAFQPERLAKDVYRCVVEVVATDIYKNRDLIELIEMLDYNGNDASDPKTVSYIINAICMRMTVSFLFQQFYLNGVN